MSQNHNTRSSAEVIPEVLEFRNKLGREWWYIVNMHVNGKYLVTLYGSVNISAILIGPCSGVLGSSLRQWANGDDVIIREEGYTTPHSNDDVADKFSAHKIRWFGQH